MTEKLRYADRRPSSVSLEAPGTYGPSSRWRDLPAAELRSRFGGLDFPAVFTGTLAALGFAALLGTAVASVSTVVFWAWPEDGEGFGLGLLLTALGVLCVSLFFGGWAAGRMARYDGGRNGFAVGVLSLLLTVGLGWFAALLGSAAALDVQLALPSWFMDGGLRLAALAAALGALLLALLVSVLGGKFGTRWHKKVDAAIVASPTGTVPS